MEFLELQNFQTTPWTKEKEESSTCGANHLQMILKNSSTSKFQTKKLLDMK